MDIILFDNRLARSAMRNNHGTDDVAGAADDSTCGAVASAA